MSFHIVYAIGSQRVLRTWYHKRQFSKKTKKYQKKFYQNVRPKVVLDAYSKFQAETLSRAVGNQFVISSEKLTKWRLWYFD